MTYSTTTRTLAFAAFCSFLVFMGTIQAKNSIRITTGLIWFGFFSGAAASTVRDGTQQLEKEKVEQFRQSLEKRFQGRHNR